MARVQLCAAIPAAVLYATDGSATSGGGLKVKIPAAGELASINTTVYLAATGGTTIAAPAFVTNVRGELPGFVEPGTYTLTVGAVSYTVEAVSQASVASLESSNELLPVRAQAAPSPATGDGATDDTSTAAAKLASAGAAGRRTDFSEGTYRVADLALPNDGVIVQGAQLGPQYSTGEMTVLKAKAGATYVLETLGLLYTRVQHIVIDGNAQAARGEHIAATATGSQSHVRDGVRYQQCSIGTLIGNGAATQADKNSFRDCHWLQNDVGLRNESTNGQQTILENAQFALNDGPSIEMAGGSLRMSGQIQGGGAGTTGIDIVGNCDWITLDDFICEGLAVDIDGSSDWPSEGVTLRNAILEGSTSNVIMGVAGSVLVAESTRFWDQPGGAGGAGKITVNAAGCKVILLNCKAGPPEFNGTHAPEVIYLDGFYGARATTTLSPSLTTATWTSLGFDTEDFDTDGLHSLVTNNSRLTVVKPGKYRIYGTVVFTANATGTREVRLLINGSVVPAGVQHDNAGAGRHTVVHVDTTWHFATAGHYVELQAYQGSGGGLTVVPSSADGIPTHFGMERL